MKKTLTLLCLLALISALPASAQIDFSRYCALGDSLTAGFTSGGLTQHYQERSFPALLANQTCCGASFAQPLVSPPGIPVLMELQSLAGPVIAAPDVAPGMPINAEYPGIYNNLGVVGANLYDMMFTTGDICNLSPCAEICDPDPDCDPVADANFDNVMHDIVLRGVDALEGLPAIHQCIGLDPTFVTVFIGNNDVLGAVLAATPIEGMTMTPVENFAGLYQEALGALVTMTTADIVVMTLPYPTAVPFVTTLPPFGIDPATGNVVLLEGTQGTLTPDSFVTLGAGSLLAMGWGLPGSPPLPDDLNDIPGVPGVVLRPDEIEIINGRIDAFNAIIEDTAAAMGVTVYDVNAWFNDLAANGGPNIGGWQPTADFLVGGMFGYDGFHLQDIGYAVFTMGFIDFINENFNNYVTQVNMYDIIGASTAEIPDIAAAKDVVFSGEAFQQLWDLFGPDVPMQTEPVAQTFVD